MEKDEMVRVLRDAFNQGDARALKAERGESLLTADYWHGYMSGIELAIDLLTENQK